MVVLLVWLPDSLLLQEGEVIIPVSRKRRYARSSLSTYASSFVFLNFLALGFLGATCRIPREGESAGLLEEGTKTGCKNRSPANTKAAVRFTKRFSFEEDLPFETAPNQASESTMMTTL